MGPRFVKSSGEEAEDGAQAVSRRDTIGGVARARDAGAIAAGLALIPGLL